VDLTPGRENFLHGPKRSAPSQHRATQAPSGLKQLWSREFERDIERRVSVPSLGIAAIAIVLWGCGGSVETPPAPPKAAPAEAEPNVEPTPVPLAAEDVLFGLQSELTTMRACLAEPGALQLRWEVDKHGAARDFAVVWGTHEQSTSAGCLAKLIGDRHFELPRGASLGSAQWTFVHELPLDAKLGSKRKARKRKGNRNQGVRFDPPGSLDSGEVDGVVEGGMRLYAHCLRAGVEAKSSISGRLALSWKVDGQGRATEMADAGSDLDDQQVVDCAAECFYALDYPKPDAAPVKITYSLLLNED
jgi:hypothetical protein